MARIGFVMLVSCVFLVSVLQSATAVPVQWSGNGHWYEAISTSYTRAQALDAVHGMSWMEMPGHLATITSQAESDFIATWIPNGGPYWIAGFQDPSASPPAQDWHWTTAEIWSYTNWRSSEPNDYYGPGSEACLELYAPSMEWNDVSCSESKPLLVEYDGFVPVGTNTWGAIKNLFNQ